MKSLVKEGDRIAQLILERISPAEIQVVEVRDILNFESALQIEHKCSPTKRVETSSERKVKRTRVSQGENLF